jgi:hypothetical protein
MDDNADAEPFRYLSHWYVTDRASPTPMQRVALPADYVFTQKSLSIAGWLQPSTSASKSTASRNLSSTAPEPIFVTLDAAEYLAFDRTRRYRGYWVGTADALYWLQQPETMRWNGALSQQDLQMEWRAALALLSNLLDLVFTDECTAAVYARSTMLDTYKALTDQCGDEPFDKELLVHLRKLVKPHLIGAYPVLSGNCKFLKSLMAAKPSKSGSLTPERILESIAVAEARSQIHPWGESKIALDRPFDPDDFAPEVLGKSEKGVETSIPQPGKKKKKKRKVSDCLTEQQKGQANQKTSRVQLDAGIAGDVCIVPSDKNTFCPLKKIKRPTFASDTTVASEPPFLASASPLEIALMTPLDLDQTLLDKAIQLKGSVMVSSTLTPSTFITSSSSTECASGANSFYGSDDNVPSLHLKRNRKASNKRKADINMLKTAQKAHSAESGTVQSKDGDKGGLRLLADTEKAADAVNTQCHADAHHLKTSKKGRSDKNDMASLKDTESSIDRADDPGLSCTRLPLKSGDKAAGAAFESRERPKLLQKTHKKPRLLKESNPFEDEGREAVVEQRVNLADLPAQKKAEPMSPTMTMKGVSTLRNEPKSTKSYALDRKCLSGPIVQNTKRMRAQMMRLRDYLSPRPLRTDNYEHWEAIKSRGHSLTDEETVISLFRLVMKDLDLASEPLELALVIVEAFRQSCCKRENDAVIKLFRFKKAIMAQKIFNDWFRHALEILEGYQKAGTSLDGTIALFLVLSIVDLIADFKIVKSADTLAKLKDERGVDWDSILIEVHIAAIKSKNDSLMTAYMRAKLRLEGIKAQDRKDLISNSLSPRDQITLSVPKPDGAVYATPAETERTLSVAFENKKLNSIDSGENQMAKDQRLATKEANDKRRGKVLAAIAQSNSLQENKASDLAVGRSFNRVPRKKSASSRRLPPKIWGKPKEIHDKDLAALWGFEEVSRKMMYNFSSKGHVIAPSDTSQLASKAKIWGTKSERPVPKALKNRTAAISAEYERQPDGILNTTYSKLVGNGHVSVQRVSTNPDGKLHGMSVGKIDMLPVHCSSARPSLENPLLDGLAPSNEILRQSRGADGVILPEANSLGRGRGRGREKTLPAWMLKEEHSRASH